MLVSPSRRLPFTHAPMIDAFERRQVTKGAFTPAGFRRSLLGTAVNIVGELMAKATKCLAAAILLASAARAEFPAERFIQAKQGGKWGLLDQKGHTVLPFAYDF